MAWYFVAISRSFSMVSLRLISDSRAVIWEVSEEELGAEEPIFARKRFLARSWFFRLCLAGWGGDDWERCVMLWVRLLLRIVAQRRCCCCRLSLSPPRLSHLTLDAFPSFLLNLLLVCFLQGLNFLSNPCLLAGFFEREPEVEVGDIL